MRGGFSVGGVCQCGRGDVSVGGVVLVWEGWC